MISNLSHIESCEIEKIHNFFWNKTKAITTNYICFIFILIISCILAIQHKNTHNFLNDNIMILIYLFLPPLHLFCNVIFIFINNKIFISIQESKKYLSKVIKVFVVFTLINIGVYFAITNYILYLDNNFENIIFMFISSIFGFVLTLFNLIILLYNLHYFDNSNTNTNTIIIDDITTPLNY